MMEDDQKRKVSMPVSWRKQSEVVEHSEVPGRRSHDRCVQLLRLHSLDDGVETQNVASVAQGTQELAKECPN